MIKIEPPHKTETVAVNNFEGIRENFGGVYVFKDRFNNVLYVGKTRRFKKRLSEHLRGYGRSKLFSQHIYTADLYTLREEYDREIYETYMIDRLNPKYNVDKVYRKENEIVADIKEKIDRLEARQFELVEESDEIIENFNRDYDEESEDDYECYDEDYLALLRLGEDLRGVERLDAIESEMGRIRAKINYYYGKL
ncbi:GIY-YIG nuclease family protein [Bacillus sp. MCCB 382]|uniref:GIY-YIG nuclease family protein n=1 Tax=Bacillus sp. MCCB 382 TaxID=2860197 RepID=UPI001C590653|nr:GIY-YIG nuclease family protein [Bacillus sp. MCCB 382]